VVPYFSGSYTFFCSTSPVAQPTFLSAAFADLHWRNSERHIVCQHVVAGLLMQLRVQTDNLLLFWHFWAVIDGYRIERMGGFGISAKFWN
jgi:hypothetical protein